MDTLNDYRRLIEESKMTASHIAKLTGLSPHTVASVIRGDGNPTIGTLELIRIAIENARDAT